MQPPRNKKPDSIDQYIVSCDTHAAAKLQQLREIIQRAAPAAEEVISYGMPAFRQGKILVYFAANKSHIGFYPTASPIEVFREELKAYKTSKGAIQFPMDQKLPILLIKRIVKFRLSQVL